MSLELPVVSSVNVYLASLPVSSVKANVSPAEGVSEIDGPYPAVLAFRVRQPDTLDCVLIACCRCAVGLSGETRQVEVVRDQWLRHVLHLQVGDVDERIDAVDLLRPGHPHLWPGGDRGQQLVVPSHITARLQATLLARGTEPELRRRVARIARVDHRVGCQRERVTHPHAHGRNLRPISWADAAAQEKREQCPRGHASRCAISRHAGPRSTPPR